MPSNPKQEISFSSPIMAETVINEICAGLNDLEQKCPTPALKEAARKLHDFIAKYGKKTIKELATSYLKPRLSIISTSKGIASDAAELVACLYIAA